MNSRNIVLCFILAATVGHAAAAGTPPKFDEVYQLLRSNLDGVSQADLDRAAVKGLVEQFPGQVTLEGSNGAAIPPAANPLSKVAVYDDSYAYLRIASVEAGLAERLRAAWQDVVRTNKSKIKGVILDLRFAGGNDYAAAAAVADCFLNSEQPLLDWGTGSAHATLKTNTIAGPVAILVNSQTAGSAEALAASLREADIGLILGGSTAGKANIFKDFSLSNGEKLRIASSEIKLGNGTALARSMKPDIAVEESLADERAYLEDPYKILHPPAPSKNQSAADSNLSTTNEPPHHPTNEAELVRERRTGESQDEDSVATSSQIIAAPEEPAAPVIADAALARALDLLKGLAVIQQSRPG
ncbi:MAG: S41 family peptidase [Verrucomicrobiota bacterium]